jgi:hypothetical protein
MDDAPESIPTAPFGAWLRALEASGRTGADMEVECGSCRGCCTSSYFIPIGPGESRALARIPKRLLFPAPGKRGYLLGYDERGHCPMFRNDACIIYADRPQACRAYDCRVFAATGFREDGKPAVAGQGERWRFAFPDPEDARLFAAVQAAARFLREHGAEFPAGFLPSQPTQLAALAIRVHAVFLGKNPRKADILAAMAEAAGTPEAESTRKRKGRASSGRTRERPGSG